MKKYIIILLVVVVLSAGGVYAYKWNQDKNNVDNDKGSSHSHEDKSEDKDQQSQSDDNEDKQQNNAEPSDSQQPDQSRPQKDRAKQKANVIITDASQYDDVIEVRSFVSNILEKGTCTIKITNGSNSVTKKAIAHPDASTTICTNPVFNRSEFTSKGEWSVTVTFESSNYYGVSETRKVIIN